MNSAQLSKGRQVLSTTSVILGLTHTVASVLAIVFLVALVFVDYLSEISGPRGDTATSENRIYSSSHLDLSFSPRIERDENTTVSQSTHAMTDSPSPTLKTQAVDAQLVSIDAQLENLRILREQVLKTMNQNREITIQNERHTIAMMASEFNQ